jgi:DNA-binding protein H-NS|tara:strand:+ start:2036 stop:2236 length:201 start_codon:yes stop_codon:yes gene_type:complete
MKNKAYNKVLDIIRSNLYEQPTNNVGGGQIAGTVEAGDDPPVRKKKKYIYMKGVRKTWTPNGRSAS